MKNRSTEWSQFEITKEPIGASPEASIKYAVPYIWGALQVTEQADERYGFVPLSEGVLREGIALKMKNPINTDVRTDIYLLSPQELAEHAITRGVPPVSKLGTGSFATTFYNDGIEVRIALDQNPDDMRDIILDDLSMIIKQFGVDIEEVRTADDISIIETMGQGASQFLVHSFCDYTAEVVRDSAIEFFKIKNNKKLLGITTKLGAIGVGSAGILLGISGIESGEVSSFTAGSAVAYTAITTMLARHGLKRHLKNVNRYDDMLANSAIIYGHLVAGDLHETYCIEHFDTQAEAMFQDE